MDSYIDGVDPDVLDKGSRDDDTRNRRKRNRHEADRRIDDDASSHRYSAKPSPWAFITDGRLKAFLGIFLLLLSVFVLFAFISHFKNAEIDQSLVKNVPLGQLAQYKTEIGNAGGGFGAWLSQALMCDALGIGALVLIPYMWILALSLLGVRKCSFWSVTFKALLVAVTLSIVAGLITYDSGSVIRWGGRHGYYVNQWLEANTTWLGAILVSGMLLCAVACVYLNELKIVWDKWQAANERRRLRQQLQDEKRRNLDGVDEDPSGANGNKPTTSSVDIDDHDLGNKADDNQDDSSNSTDNPEPDRSQPYHTQPLHGYDSGMDDVLDSGADDNGFNIDFGDDNTNGSSDSRYQPNAQGGPNNHASETDKPTDYKAPHGSEDPDDSDSGDNDIIIEDAPEEFLVNATEIEEAKKINTNPSNIPYDHRAELSRYKFPSIDLLEERAEGRDIDMAEQQANKDRIIQTLLQYKIPISRIEATVGPTVTLYEIVPAEGVRISQIKRLEDDIALSLKALGVRIIAPIPGKGTVGIEVPNRDPKIVSMRKIITSKKFQECNMLLPMAMGATISNDIFIADLAKMPHLLVAGATGQGKSVGLNAIIASLLYKKHPSELKFVLVDPKMVEFSLYSKLERHYLAKLPDEEDAIITDTSKVLQTLNSLCIEMDNRFMLLRDAGVRNLEEYNKKFTERRLNPEKGHKYLPYIVVIVDEFADLIMTAGKEVENPIKRIAQKARAVGIHMIIATQRPSTNVITGVIKANFPGRVAFKVSQMVDSKTIIDRSGAQQLIGKGDMLFSRDGNIERVQCAFISTEEVEAITEYIDEQVGFPTAYLLPEYFPENGDAPIAGASTDRDPLFEEAARFVVGRQQGSTSILQRQFSIGYNRAGKLIDQMEAAGIVGPINGSKPREIRVDMITLEHILNQS